MALGNQGLQIVHVEWPSCSCYINPWKSSQTAIVPPASFEDRRVLEAPKLAMAAMAAIGLLVADTSWSNSRPRGNDPSFDNIGHKVGVVGVVGVWVGGVKT